MAKKSGLGRGLESLLGETAGEVKDEAKGIAEIDLGVIKTNPGQPRVTFDERELEELADSIRKNGVLQPILVRRVDTGYQIVAGERRYQAAKMAGLTKIPAVVRELDDDHVFLLALIENLQRSDLNPMEEARGYRTLMEQNGLTQQQLSEALSKSRSAIANTLRLTELPDEIQGLVAEGLITAGHARAILSLSDEASQVGLARRVVAEGLTVRQTETLASLLSGRAEKPTRVRASQPDTYRRAADELQNLLGTKVSVRKVRGKSKIEIEFADEDQLKDLIQRMVPSGMDEKGA